MRLFIPTKGDAIRLTQDWTFQLHSEPRNHDLFEALGLEFRWHGPLHAVTLPAGTVLKIDRVYIRGNREYDSVTFRTFASPNPALASKKNGGNGKSRRFWAKLADVNQIEYERADV